MNLEMIWNGVLAGIVYSLSGYFKNKPEGHDFDYTKFMNAIYLGAFSGLLYSFSGIELEQAQSIMLQIGIVAIVKNFLHGLGLGKLIKTK